MEWSGEGDETIKGSGNVRAFAFVCRSEKNQEDSSAKLNVVILNAASAYELSTGTLPYSETLHWASSSVATTLACKNAGRTWSRWRWRHRHGRSVCGQRETRASVECWSDDAISIRKHGCKSLIHPRLCIFIQQLAVRSQVSISNFIHSKTRSLPRVFIKNFCRRVNELWG